MASVIDSQDDNFTVVIVDPVHDTKRAAAGDPQPFELAAQRLPDAVRCRDEVASEERNDRYSNRFG